MTTPQEATRALFELIITREQYRPVWTALMGDGTGTVEDPDDPDKVFVRVHGLQSSVASVFNKAVPTNRPDLPVMIGVTREQPYLVQVLGVDWSALPTWNGTPMLPLHGPEHQLPNGSDPVYIQKRAIIPLRASPQDPPDMTLHIYPDYYPFLDGWQLFEETDSEDLTARVPATANMGRFVTLYVDGATNTLAYQNGAEGIAYPPPMAEPLEIPMPPAGSVPVCAVRLYNGMAAVYEDDIYDVRILISPLGGSLTPATHPLDPLGGQHSGRLDTRHLWASVACCGAQ